MKNIQPGCTTCRNASHSINSFSFSDHLSTTYETLVIVTWSITHVVAAHSYLIAALQTGFRRLFKGKQYFLHTFIQFWSLVLCIYLFFSVNDLRLHRLLDAVFSKHNSNFFPLLPNAPCYLEISRLFIDMHNTFLSHPIMHVREPQGKGTN